MKLGLEVVQTISRAQWIGDCGHEERNLSNEEGLLEKISVEMKTFFSNPTEYESTMRNIGNTQVENNLEGIQKCLEVEM